MTEVESVMPLDSEATPELHEAAPEPTDVSTALATTNPEGKKIKKIVKKKRRPARPQVDPDTFKSEPPPQTGTIFNIWYNKWSGGDREDKYLSKTAAPSRCDVAKDSGYTRGDKVPGTYFCLFFARGLCPRGHECEYLHRLPTVTDLYNPNVDCFGRDKFSDYRDDMGGVGSFMRQNRTLYVGRIHVTDDIEEIVARHFQQWGQVERIRVLTARGVAFVTYSNEANSQFAKEAMAHQALDHSEILNVRWATVDPNPQAQKREAHRIEEQAAEAIRQALPAEYVAEIEGRDVNEIKRRRLESSGRRAELEGPGQQLAIEAPTGSSLEDQQLQALHQAQLQQYEQAEQKSGIFSSSTLAALKGYSVGSGGQQKSSIVSGHLVAYGSDSEDED